MTITLLAAGESPTYGGVDYAKPVILASQFNERPFHQALDMIALERLGQPIPQKLFKSHQLCLDASQTELSEYCEY